MRNAAAEILGGRFLFLSNNYPYKGKTSGPPGVGAAVVHVSVEERCNVSLVVLLPPGQLPLVAAGRLSLSSAATFRNSKSSPPFSSAPV